MTASVPPMTMSQMRRYRTPARRLPVATTPQAMTHSARKPSDPAITRS